MAAEREVSVAQRLVAEFTDGCRQLYESAFGRLAVSEQVLNPVHCLGFVDIIGKPVSRLNLWFVLESEVGVQELALTIPDLSTSGEEPAVFEVPTDAVHIPDIDRVRGTYALYPHGVKRGKDVRVFQTDGMKFRRPTVLKGLDLVSSALEQILERRLAPGEESPEKFKWYPELDLSAGLPLSGSETHDFLRKYMSTLSDEIKTLERSLLEVTTSPTARENISAKIERNRASHAEALRMFLLRL